MPFPRPTLTALRTGAMQDITGSDLPNADGFLRRSPLRVLAWVQAGLAYLHYGFLDWIARMGVPFTAEDEYLEAWAALAPTPVIRTPPQPASGSLAGTGTPTRVLPANTLVYRSGDQAQYRTTADATVAGDATLAFTILAVVPGATGNTDAGAPFVLSGAFSGINPEFVASGPITGGDDLETDASLRTRMLESYAAPPHGGNQDDYETWALQVSGVTRAWVPAVPLVPGTVTVWFMMDVSQAAHGGFPQGTDGGATLETRVPMATGDQLEVADHIFPLRPVTVIVVVKAPLPQPQDFTITGLTGTSTAQRDQVAASLTNMFFEKDSPLGDTSIHQSDVDAAIAGVPGLPSFAITIPNTWPITSDIGYLFTLGVITYP